MRLRPGEVGYDLGFKADAGDPLQTLVVPVAQSAAEFLAGSDLTLVKPCENTSCVLVFYDTTKHHRRRWCSMSSCGNRAKAARHYRRVHDDAAHR